MIVLSIPEHREAFTEYRQAWTQHFDNLGRREIVGDAAIAASRERYQKAEARLDALADEHDAYERNRTDEGDMLHDVGCYCECPECIGS